MVGDDERRFMPIRKNGTIQKISIIYSGDSLSKGGDYSSNESLRDSGHQPHDDSFHYLFN